MKISISQVYIEPGVRYPLTIVFQQFISRKLSSLSSSNPTWAERFGDDWDIIIRLSAKRNIGATEIKGPTVFNRDKSVEYTVFLPFPLKQVHFDCRELIVEILKSSSAALMSLGLDTHKLDSEREAIAIAVCNDARMFHDQRGAYDKKE